MPYVVLYGLGVTIGAGIYVLIGEVIARSGQYAPIPFLIAGLVMLFPAAAFAEFTGRLPFAAAEARFVEAGFPSRSLFLIVGLAVALVGVVSSAAIAHGAVGYIGQLIDMPAPMLLGAVILVTGAISGIGIRDSIMIAGLLTVIEIGGLMAIVIGAIYGGAGLTGQAMAAIPHTLEPGLWAAVIGTSLLAFFAFIGFEDIDSIAEETVEPQKTLARAIFITLGVTVFIYVAVVLAALTAVSQSEMSGSSAPLALVFARTTGLSPITISLIAIVATINGIIVQLIMASRDIYGLANRGALPAILARFHPKYQTPVVAAMLVVALTLVLALAFPIATLAQGTSLFTLVIFILVCASLVRVKRSGVQAPPGTFIVPVWVPYAGIIACSALLVAGLVVD